MVEEHTGASNEPHGAPGEGSSLSLIIDAALLDAQ